MGVSDLVVRIRQYPFQALLTACIVLFHVFGVAWLAWFSASPSLSSVPQQVRVRTVTLRPPAKVVPKRRQPKVAAPTAKPKKKPKKVAKVKKKAPVKKRVVESRSVSKHLAEALDNLDKITDNTHTLSPSNEISVPTTLGPLSIDREFTSETSSVRGMYREELVRRLQLLLRLPEQGEVKVALTVSQEGKVLGLKILSAGNGLNRAYIENKLGGLTFSPLGPEFAGKEAQTFTLVLKSHQG